jgi:hypothetical protein
MTEIEELLAKLKELDPETWLAFRQICSMTWVDSSPLDDPAICTPVYGWALQGVIQDAIMSQPSGAGRQWIYHVRGRTAASGPDYRALAGVLEVVDGEVVDRPHEAHGDTPADAILAAYIAALEAEHGRR